MGLMDFLGFFVFLVFARRVVEVVVDVVVPTGAGMFSRVGLGASVYVAGER